MRNSEIFDEFCKIAQKNGIISPDAPEKAKKVLENNPRADSMSISNIEALYGVKPDLPKDMQYDYNIMQDAHPNAVIVSPSYDKLNGLVENNNERQSIIINIMNKVPNGLLTQHKYAQQQLMMSLVRVANDLDNRNIDDLRKLADTCLTQLAPAPLKKFALLPLLGVMASIIGVIYLQQHLAMSNEGFEQNNKQLLAEIDDLLNSNSNWGVGNDYTPQFKEMLNDFKSKLNDFYNVYQKDKGIINSLQTPKTAKDLIPLAQQPESNDAINAAKELQSAHDNMLTYINTIKNDFSSQSYKATQVQDEGFLSKLVDKFPFLHGGHGLIADDFDDVKRALDAYETSVQEMLSSLRSAQSIQHDAAAKLNEAAEASQKMFGQDGGTLPATSPSTSPAAKDSDNTLEKGMKEVEDFFGK